MYHYHPTALDYTGFFLYNIGITLNVLDTLKGGLRSMKKTILTIIAAVVLFPSVLFCGYIKGGQFAMAQKYADKDEAPVVFFNPGNGDAGGYIIYADLNNDGVNEMIIPYRIHKSLEKVEDNADIYRQTLSIDVVQKGKKYRGILQIDLAYNYTPKVYLTVKSLKRNELPKIFVMVNDGVKKKDTKFTLMYNSYDKKDKGREQKIFETEKMPWELILYQFDRSAPTITEFDINYEQSHGKYYIRPLDGPDKTVRVSPEAMTKFEAELKKARNDIFFELEE
jgi:hypothetical protein